MQFKQQYFSEVKYLLPFNILHYSKPERPEITEEFCKQFHDAVTVVSNKIKAGKKPKFVRMA